MASNQEKKGEALEIWFYGPLVQFALNGAERNYIGSIIARMKEMENGLTEAMQRLDEKEMR